MDLEEMGGQPMQGLTFDDAGELTFTEAGFEAFKGLIETPQDGQDAAVPERTEDEVTETPEEEQATEGETTPEDQPQPAPAKRQLKVNGQTLEVDDEQLTALAQMGADYQQKMTDWREKDNSLAPYEALIKQLQTDPGLNEHLRNYFRPPQKAPEKPQFDDPIDQLKWETEQEVLRKVDERIKGVLEQNIAPLHKQTALNQVRQTVMADPDYRDVQAEIIKYVQGLPPALQKTTYAQLDQDPQAYLEMFGHYKQQIAAARAKPATPTTNDEPPLAEKEPATTVKRTEKAPILGSPNAAPQTPEQSIQKRQRIDKARATALRSNGSVEALAAFIDEIGFDNLK